MGDLATLERRFSTLLALDTLDGMTASLRPPAEGEFGPFYAGYVARVAHITAPLDELTAQRARLLDLLSPLSDEQGAFRYAQGKWSITELLGHLTDAERIFSYRLLRIGRGDGTPLPGWDENGYARTASFDRRTLDDVLDEWVAARDSTIALVRGLPADAWPRRGMASDAPVTTRALLYIILGHVEHHVVVLRERYGVR